ncbi:MAG TPA: hypothetical protein VHN13_19825 [Candidatus Tectomicrobia bacterium]|nr:hypothetical protein [Candidatus Tectomicrobia bacterium]
MHRLLLCLLISLGGLALLGGFGGPASAHHGGLGIEGDIIEWSLKVDQWQQEHFANGHRIKFLAYPRNAIANRVTRLVFEVQSVTTGQYVGGLTVDVSIRTPQGEEHTLAAPEIPGVTAYYELPFTFLTTGEHTITFRTQANSQVLSVAFTQSVSPNPLFGDWPTMVGNGAVLTAFMVTWVGAVLALQRRLLPEN